MIPGQPECPVFSRTHNIPDAALISGQPECPVFSRTHNIPDAVLIPGQPECPVFSRTHNIPDAVLIPGQPECPIFSRTHNIPDAVLIPGQPECPVFSRTQRSSVMHCLLKSWFPEVVSQVITLIIVSTNDDGPNYCIIPKIVRSLQVLQFRLSDGGKISRVTYHLQCTGIFTIIH